MESGVSGDTGASNGEPNGGPLLRATRRRRDDSRSDYQAARDRIRCARGVSGHPGRQPSSDKVRGAKACRSSDFALAVRQRISLAEAVMCTLTRAARVPSNLVVRKPTTRVWRSRLRVLDLSPSQQGRTFAVSRPTNARTRCRRMVSVDCRGRGEIGNRWRDHRSPCGTRKQPR
jgi:hypothetical protein